ncbi:MAG: hypothetical protein ACM3JB_19805 [Acidobacteriaceae bacterium]
MGTPESIVKGLNSGDPQSQSTLANLLGLTHFDPQQDFRECDIRSDDVKLDDSNDTSVLQVKCGYHMNIVVLRRHGAMSEPLDSQYLYAAYDRSQLDFASVIHPYAQEIIVHNAATVSGNLYEAYFLVLRLTKTRKLKVVLSTLETGTEPRYGGTPRNQKSTFTITPASPTESGEINQLATIQVGSQSYTVRRVFEWSDEWQTFIEAGVQGIQSHRH